MTESAAAQHDSPATPLRPVVVSILATAAATAALLAGLFAWARPGDGPDRFVGFAFAAMLLGWLGGCVAVGPRLTWPAVFRWGTTVDVAGIALLIAAAVSPAVTWTVGLKLYAILAAFACLPLSAMWLLTRRGGSGGRAAVAGVALAAVACTSLLWGHLPDRPTTPGSAADVAVLTAVRYANPLLAANDAVNPPIPFDWAHHGQMYRRFGLIGEGRTLAMPNWPRACAAYLLGAALLSGIGAISRRRPSASAGNLSLDFASKRISG